VLTTPQLEQYRADGFLVLPDFVERDACTALRRRAGDVVAAFAPRRDEASVFSTTEQTHARDEYFLTSGDKVRCFLESAGEGGSWAVNKIGHALHDLDPVFENFSYAPPVAELADDVGYTDPRLLQSMYILKEARVGGEVVAHCDHTFLWTEPQTVSAFWFAIDAATIENGCLWALPGGHRLPPRARFRREGSGTTMDVYDPTPYPTDGMVPLEADVGTLVLLHGLLPHRSGPNRSDKPRHAYSLHIIDSSATYRDDNWLQRGPDMPLRALHAAPSG
jgi:phytanoyl-CoA hydroxylase